MTSGVLEAENFSSEQLKQVVKIDGNRDIVLIDILKSCGGEFHIVEESA